MLREFYHNYYAIRLLDAEKCIMEAEEYLKKYKDNELGEVSLKDLNAMRKNLNEILMEDTPATTPA